jgi:hypothetical protein
VYIWVGVASRPPGTSFGIVELIVICCAWLENAGASSANVARAGISRNFVDMRTPIEIRVSIWIEGGVRRAG